MDTLQSFPVRELVSEQLQVSETSWSIGVLGALAEFHRDDSEPCARGATWLATERGALRFDIPPRTRAIAYEVVTQNVETWNHGVALCLPQQSCAMSARHAIAELGPDRDAIREQDRDSILFDLGLGSPYCDFAVRTSDPRRIAQLRAAVGTSLFDPRHDLIHDIPRWSPHRVFISRLGRIEVYQRIGAHEGVTPEGPHTHLLEKLLRANRTHSANLALPDGLVPCATFYPPNPVRDDHGHARPFHAGYHASFKALMERFGEADVIAVKRAVCDAVRSGMPPDALELTTRRARTACRIALRQMLHTDGESPTLTIWREAYEPSLRTRPLTPTLSPHAERGRIERRVPAAGIPRGSFSSPLPARRGEG